MFSFEGILPEDIDLKQEDWDEIYAAIGYDDAEQYYANKPPPEVPTPLDAFVFTLTPFPVDKISRDVSPGQGTNQPARHKADGGYLSLRRTRDGVGLKGRVANVSAFLWEICPFEIILRKTASSRSWWCPQLMASKKIRPCSSCNWYLAKNLVRNFTTSWL